MAIHLRLVSFSLIGVRPLPGIIIESIDDPRLQVYRNIRHHDPSADGQRFIAEGRLVVERLLHSRYRCESLLVERDHHKDLVALAERIDPSTRIFAADPTCLRQIVGFDFHRGILACGIRPTPHPIQRLGGGTPHSSSPVHPHEPGADGPTSPLLCICGVNNPENIGGLMRTAAAFGIRQLALSPDVADPFSRRALRVSMASALRLEIYAVSNPAEDVRYLSAHLGYRTVASTLAAGAMPLGDFRQDARPLAILVGSEGEGLPESIQREATDRVTIPMQSGTDSLNVNVAAAIFLYELTRRTLSSGEADA